MPSCDCGRYFQDEILLKKHQRDSQHHYCPYCDRGFGTTNGLEQHIGDLHPYLCGHCNQKFRTEDSLDHHQKVTNHYYCRSCDRPFNDNQALGSHLRDSSAHHYSYNEEWRPLINHGERVQRAMEQQLNNTKPQANQRYHCCCIMM